MLKKQLKQTIAKIFLGNNYFLRNVIARQVREGKYFKAAAMLIFTAPFRKVLTCGPLELIFINSPNYYREIHKLLHISKVEGFDLVRIGRDNDGGYIMLNDFNQGGIAYSFGISDEVSWDKDMARRGYDVFMYDHTIKKLPEENSRFHFFRQGLSSSKNNSEQLKTLEYFIKQNNHDNQSDMILKMDVEGAEWGFLESVKPETLSQFSQLTFEFHDIINRQSLKKYSLYFILRKINETHQLIHLHANNNGAYITVGGKNFCSLFEVTYVLRDKYKFVSDYDVNLPLKLDMPNIKAFPEIILGRWNEEFKPDDKIKVVIPV